MRSGMPGQRRFMCRPRFPRMRWKFLVQDDGRGFEPLHPPAEGRQHGLGNMRRRAETIGGTLGWQSAPGKGTTVRLAVNLANGTVPRNA